MIKRSLGQQIAALVAARDVMSGAARPPASAIERQYHVEGIEAARATLQWLMACEETVRVAIEWAFGGDAPYKPPVTRDGQRKEKRAFADLPPGQRAALRCGDARYRVFLCGEDKGVDAAADALRARCEIKSRAELNSDAAAAARFAAIELEYAEWLVAQRHGEAR